MGDTNQAATDVALANNGNRIASLHLTSHQEVGPLGELGLRTGAVSATKNASEQFKSAVIH